MTKSIYMDYAAATPMDERVIAAMQPYFADNFYNPSSVYLASRQVKQELADARALVAHWLGARPSEITFTAGATEANNIAIHGVISAGGDALCSTIEHDAVLEPVQAYDHQLVKVDERGMLDLDDLRKKIGGKTKLVSVIYANNEIGSVQHISEIAKVVHEERDKRIKDNDKNPIYLHSDASQAANYLDLHVDKLGVDLMTINGGKMYGPKQSGALYVRAGIELSPIFQGGGQEHGLRSGTENVAASIGMAKALDIAQKSRKDEAHRLQNLSTVLMSSLKHEIADVEFLGHKRHRLPNLVSAVIPKTDGERIVMMLDEVGIQVATGSACSANSDESSHVVQALGRTENEANSTLRISLGRHTTEADVNKLVEVLPNIVEKARQLV